MSTIEPGPKWDSGGTQIGKVRNIRTYFQAKGGGLAPILGTYKNGERSGGSTEDSPLEKDPGARI